jgi:hypothetical protein
MAEALAMVPHMRRTTTILGVRQACTVGGSSEAAALPSGAKSASDMSL